MVLSLESTPRFILAGDAAAESVGGKANLDRLKKDFGLVPLFQNQTRSLYSVKAIQQAVDEMQAAALSKELNG